jgi:hypothetical protein
VARHSPIAQHLLPYAASCSSAPQCWHEYGGLVRAPVRPAHLRPDQSLELRRSADTARSRTAGPLPSNRALDPARSPLMVGVEPPSTLRFQNVVVRFLPRLTGSPSAPAEAGKRSTSSNSAIRIGREARPAGRVRPGNGQVAAREPSCAAACSRCPAPARVRDLARAEPACPGSSAQRGPSTTPRPSPASAGPAASAPGPGRRDTPMMLLSISVQPT